MVDFKATATYENQPLSKLAELVQARMVYLHQTVEKALDATAVTVLRSLRALTKTAKPDKIKIEPAEQFVVSFSRLGGRKPPKPCIRWRGGARLIKTEGERHMFTPSALADSRSAKVFAFTLGYGRKAARYLVGAASAAEARKIAREIQQRRLKRFKGLAKLALGTLMYKVATMSAGQNDVTQAARSVAQANTIVQRMPGSITLFDKLDYAALALKNGPGDINLAAQKAANSIASMINKKLQNKGFSDRLGTPFPEIKGK